MVFERLRELLSDQLGVSADDISMDSHIMDDLGADSLDLVELLTSFEDEFDLVITDEAARELRTVREVVEFIEKLI
ncbi:MAG: acyl carrier protein [Oscillospiraceae bacterium]|nr:acyl carrier protein [Oscillospiraceae bacterium]